MSHQLLILNADEQAAFDKDEVLRALGSIHGVRGLAERPPSGSLVYGDFDFKDDRTTVELSDDLKRLSLTGTGVAALQLALEFKARVKAPLRAFDTSYSFDLLLDGVSDLDDFQRKVAADDEL